MSLTPQSFASSTSDPRFARVLAGLLGAMALAGGDAAGENPPRARVSPEPITEEDFAALKANSPFLRSVGTAKSMVLTGVARIGSDVFVTVVDTQTRETRLVSQTANSQGWQLVSFKGDEADLESFSAKIQVTGGEVISIRYEKLPPPKRASGKPGAPSQTRPTRLSSTQFREARHAALNFREGFSADGYPKQPPREIVEKLSKISPQKRESINREMLELRNRGLGMDERRRIYVDKVNRATGARR